MFAECFLKNKFIHWILQNQTEILIKSSKSNNNSYLFLVMWLTLQNPQYDFEHYETQQIRPIEVSTACRIEL